MINPSLSVVMPCYNEEELLPRAVDSILTQTLTDFELLLIDDGSTDRTRQIIQDYAGMDSRVVPIINSYNLGLSASLNRGIQRAKADIIARMDGDDESLPNRFEEQFNYLSDYPEVDICGSAVFCRHRDQESYAEELRLPENHADIVARIFRKTLVFHPTIMIRKKVFDLYGKYDPAIRWAEDADLWYRIYDKVTWANLPEPLLIYTKKDKMTKRIAKQNLKVKILNLRRRSILFQHIPQLTRDALQYGYRLMLQK
ncbi:MAG: glycosyltransferase family 2 protein [Bacteroidota bacterium]